MTIRIGETSPGDMRECAFIPDLLRRNPALSFQAFGFSFIADFRSRYFALSILDGGLQGEEDHQALPILSIHERLLAKVPYAPKARWKGEPISISRAAIIVSEGLRFAFGPENLRRKEMLSSLCSWIALQAGTRKAKLLLHIPGNSVSINIHGGRNPNVACNRFSWARLLIRPVRTTLIPFQAAGGERLLEVSGASLTSMSGHEKLEFAGQLQREMGIPFRFFSEAETFFRS